MNGSINALLSRVGGVVLLAVVLSVQPAQSTVYTLSGVLDASQVVDGGGSTSTATGYAVLSINTGDATATLDAESLTLDFSWSGLTGPADRAHLHDAPAGTSRLVFDPFDLFFDEVFYNDNPLRTVDCSSWSAFGLCVPPSGSLHFVQPLSLIILNFPTDQFQCDPQIELCTLSQFLTLALTDSIYLDMHTQAYSSGEIRGQLLPVSEPPMTLLLSCLAMVGVLVHRTAIGRKAKSDRHTVPEPA